MGMGRDTEADSQSGGRVGAESPKKYFGCRYCISALGLNSNTIPAVAMDKDLFAWHLIEKHSNKHDQTLRDQFPTVPWDEPILIEVVEGDKDDEKTGMD